METGNVSCPSHVVCLGVQGHFHGDNFPVDVNKWYENLHTSCPLPIVHSHASTPEFLTPDPEVFSFWVPDQTARPLNTAWGSTHILSLATPPATKSG